MKQKSAGAVIFRRDGGKIYYLLLRHSSLGKVLKPYWNFPKGHVEEGENIYETIKREVKEETGLEDINIVKGFKEFENYFFKFKGETIFKMVIFLLAETKTKEVKISLEHADYKWAEFEEALKILKFKKSKELLEKANGFILKKDL